MCILMHLHFGRKHGGCFWIKFWAGFERLLQLCVLTLHIKKKKKGGTAGKIVQLASAYCAWGEKNANNVTQVLFLQQERAGCSQHPQRTDGLGCRRHRYFSYAKALVSAKLSAKEKWTYYMPITNAWRCDCVMCGPPLVHPLEECSQFPQRILEEKTNKTTVNAFFFF